MGLPLLTVRPAQGPGWIQRAWQLWRQRPLGFIGLFTSYWLLALLLITLLPWVGGLLALVLAPQLTLAYMVAARSAQAGGAVHALQLAAGLRHPQRQRRLAQWQLGLAYAVATVAMVQLADWLDGGALDAWMGAGPLDSPDAGGSTGIGDDAGGGADAPADADADDATPPPAGAANPDGADPGADGQPAIGQALDDPRLLPSLALRGALAALVSVPFWYAPALVHWGGQSAVQALFSSTVALWRSRGALFLYGLVWALLLLGAALAVAVLSLASGSGRLVMVFSTLAALALCAWFYVSIWFGYTDSFGTPATVEDATPTPPPTASH